MNKMTRKDFLRLSMSAGAVVATGVPTIAAAQSATARPGAPAIASGASRFLIKGADVLSMDPKLGEITGADVLVENGKIVQVQPGIAASDAQVIDARGKILIPGMVDGHRHIWEGLQTGHLVKTHPKKYSTYQDSKKRVMVSMTAEDHYTTAYMSGLQAIDSGVTSLFDYAHIQYSEDRAVAAAQGLKDSGVAGWFTYQVSHTPSFKPGDTVSLAKAAAEQAALADEEHFRIASVLQKQLFSDSSAPLQLGLAMSVGSFGAPMAAVKKELERIRSYGVGIIGWHSHRPNQAFPAGHFGARDSGILDLYEAGLLGPDLHLSHGNALTAEELKLIAEKDVKICSTAVGEFPYAARGPRFFGAIHGKARKAGVGVGIGIDVGVALPQDYFEHIRGAFWNLFTNEESVKIAQQYVSEDVFDFATRLGARAINLDKVAGTITPGKRADLVLLNTDRIGFAVQGTLADRVVNFGSLADIDSVWVNGRLRKQGGKMLGVDWADLKRKQIKAAEEVEARAQSLTFTA